MEGHKCVKTAKYPLSDPTPPKRHPFGSCDNALVGLQVLCGCKLKRNCLERSHCGAPPPLYLLSCNLAFLLTSSIIQCAMLDQEHSKNVVESTRITGFGCSNRCFSWDLA